MHDETMNGRERKSGRVRERGGEMERETGVEGGRG
jgi:hypothetical protein